MCLALFVFLPQAKSEAIDYPPQLKEIFYKTTTLDGSLTRETHDEFWEILNQSLTEAQIGHYTTYLLAAQKYQKEIWVSAKFSYENGRIVKTNKLIMLQVGLPLKFEKMIPFPKKSAEYISEWRTYQRKFKESVKKANGILELAASRPDKRQNRLINWDQINNAIAHTEGSYSRLEKLLTETWHD
ncbi:hypothetical protein SAMN05216233_1217 [Desulfoluna spongiiphila]|uniref:Uncharacterized protein n=1 Tax=Desulfoluna spongiiphila TaxID=419481 RepID=A0A1G5INM3_9BACT|nr:hypothetical protein SAMN05216233_1217 [Desulfoluna spongiiphila]VVS92613.1 hypothetical protein DBB_21810 [Desulfoluna spongiiphila]